MELLYIPHNQYYVLTLKQPQFFNLPLMNFSRFHCIYSRGIHA